MKRILPVILLSFTFLFDAKGQDLILQLDRHHSSLNFSVGYLGLMKQKGSFDNFDCTVIYDEVLAMPKSVTLVAGMGSIDTNNRIRDSHLKSADFLNVEEFPKAIFQSDHIEAKGNRQFAVEGRLSLNGKEKLIRFNLEQEYKLTTDRSKSRRVGFVGSIEINRKDFGIEGGNAHNSRFNVKDQIIGDVVHMSFSIQSMLAIGTDWPPAVTMLAELERNGVEEVIKKFGEALRKFESDPSSATGAQGTQAIALMELANVLAHTNRKDDSIALLEKLDNYENRMTLKGKMILLEAYARKGDKIKAFEMINKLSVYQPFNPLVMEISRMLK